MKKITSLLAALLLTCGLSWAQTTIDWTAADQGYENGKEIESIEFDGNVSATFNKGSNNNAPKYYTTGSAIRCYGGNYFTITSADGNLQNITLSFATGEGSNAITTDNGNYENGTWTGDAASVTFTIGGTSGHRRIAAFAITYGGDGPAVAMPTFSPEGGTYEEAQTVTISCETENVDIFYTLDGTTPDDESIYYSGPITIEETTTIKAIAYDSEDNASVVATATYTIIDPNAPGSVNNPYTVAQARAAIDAGTGTQNVYATGIVSEIPTAYSNQYNNITFNMVDEEGDEEFLQAYRCGGDEAADVQIGDVVVVYGNLTLYNNSIYEFAQGCQVVSLTHPVITEPVITLSPATVNVEAGEAEGALTMTYINMGDEPLFEVMYFEADGETEAEYDWIIAEVDGDQVEYLIEANEGEARTAYLKVYGTDGTNDVYSNLVTINQEAYVEPALDYATLPFEFNGGRADIEGTDGLTQEGLGADYNANNNPTTKLKFDNTGDWMLLHFDEVPGTLTFDIKGNSFSGGTFTVQTSEDGETFEELASYTELGNTETKTFADLDENVRYIKWIYTTKSAGNVGLGGIHLYEVGGGPVLPASITVAPATVNATYEATEGTLTVTYQNITEVLAEVYFCDAEGNEATYEWIDADIDEDNNVYYLIETNEGEARTAYLKVYALDDNAEDVYSNLVTINQAAYVAPFEGATYTLADAIESGRHYIIVGFNDEDAYAMGGQNNNNRAAVAININEGVAEVESADVYEFVINGPDANGFYTIYDAAVPGYLYAASNSYNYLRTREFNIDENSQWTIEFDEENGSADITAQGDYTRNWMRFNKNGNGLFACYADGQQDIYLYVKDEDTYEYYVDVKGYAGNAGNWCLIAAPIDNVDPANVTHMIEPNDFDLYFFDQSFEAEWRNYKTQTFNLEAGKGYLYANYENVTLKFEGEPCESDGVVYLDYDESASCKGFNLVGNPFTYAATIDYDFYIMNEAGTELENAERELVNPFEGVFVQAEGEDEVLVFAAPTSGTGGSGFGGGGSFKLNLRVSNNEGKGDFARVRFGEGNGLEKFMLNPANTKLYFPMGGNDYAAICAANIGEMPLNFKAATEGTYTLSANWGEMEMDYLHLIDNLTGSDVDLLATPSYSFDATMSDNAARFTLQFATTTGIEENQAEEFAFFSNGTLIVSNEGNATLQVIDMTGRIVSSQTINGSASVSLNATSGVYVLRLVNGDNAKVQKIVVK